MLSNSERKKGMRKTTLCGFTSVVLFSLLMIASVHATTVSIEADISRDFSVVFELTVTNETMYNNLKANPNLMNASTVPETVWSSFVSSKQLALDALAYSDNIIEFNDTAHSIHAMFHLSGPAIINSTINRVANVENFKMSTEWRKFNLDIPDGFSYDFAHSLATPLSGWTNTVVNGITSYSYSNITAGVSCSFKLPSYASNVFASGETIFFDTPYEPPWEDKLINSPVLILIGFAIVGVGVFVYRKIR
jgi:hypothetical protein